MPTSTGRRPFAELCEVCQNELVREGASGERSKYEGFVNQIYINDLPSVLPELYIKKEAYLTLVGEMTTGTVTVGTGTVNVIGAGVTWTTAHSDQLFSVTGENVRYRVTFGASTSLTFNDSLTWIGSSGTGLTYSLVKDRYQLPSDFGYMIQDDPDEPHVIYRWVNGQKIYLNNLNEEEFEQQNSWNAGTPWAYCVKWIKEIPYLYLTLAAQSVEILGYSYIPTLTTLSRYTTGTITLTNTTAVIASGSAWSANVTTALNTYFLRNEADGTGSASRWAQIASVANDTALTLTSSWGFTSGAAQTYTISEVSKWPVRFDDAILYKTALIVDPDSVNTKKWDSVYVDAVGADRATETKRTQARPFKGWPGLRKGSRS